MKIEVLFFGIAADLANRSQLEITVEKGTTVFNCKRLLQKKYPSLENIDTYAIAVNETYSDNNLVIQENDVIAIIPPVSGG